MLISDITPFTLIDYPDHTASIIFTAGCNMRCGFCHNPELVLQELIKKNTLIPEEVVFNFLEKRKGLIDGVVISGGEPTVQKDLIEFIKKVKNLGFLVKLDTNGTNPKKLQTLISENLVDYVAMDIKASKEKYKKLTKFKSWDKIERSIKILIESNIIYEFRTTLIDGFHDVQEFRSLLNNIKGSKKYSIGTFRNTHVLDPRFKNMRAFKPKVINKFAKIAENYVQKVNVY